MKRISIIGLMLMVLAFGARAATQQNFWTTTPAPATATVGQGGTGLTGVGSAGQVLTSTGSALAYSNAPAAGATNFVALTNGTANNLTINGVANPSVVLGSIGAQPTNTTLTTLAGGSLAPLIGTTATTALAGNTPISSLSGTVAIANGGTGQVTAAGALTALGGASLTANQTISGSNQFGILGNVFPNTVWLRPTNIFTNSATLSSSGGFTMTSTGGFGPTNMPNLTSFPMGFQIQMITNNSGAANANQYWGMKIPNANTFNYRPSGGNPNFTNLNFLVYPPAMIITDINGHPQADIQSDGTFESACGSFTFNGGVGGGYWMNDFQYSMGMKMGNSGGIEGEGFELVSQTNGSNPTITISPLAPNFCLNVLPSGLLDLQVGLTNDASTTLLIGNLILQSGKTNQPTGQFTLNGSTTTNIGNTMVSATTHIHYNEVLPNGGTATGTIIPVSVTAGTGFAIKGVALDTSVCDYWLVNTN